MNEWHYALELIIIITMLYGCGQRGRPPVEGSYKQTSFYYVHRITGAKTAAIPCVYAATQEERSICGKVDVDGGER